MRTIRFVKVLPYRLGQPPLVQNWTFLEGAYSLLKAPRLAILEDPRLHLFDHLNGLLSSRSLSPVRSVLRSPWNDISERTKRQHTRKAKQLISVMLEEIAPQEPERLWQTLTSARSMNDDNVDMSLMKALADCYNKSSKWDTRRQILSYMADKASFQTILQYIPGLTRYRFSVARHHILEHGRGVPVPSVPHTRRVVPQEQLSHFLDFITSTHIILDLPFGGKTITLSNKEVIQVPNVVRNMIPERIVRQLQCLLRRIQVQSIKPQYPSMHLASVLSLDKKVSSGTRLLQCQWSRGF